MEKKFEDFKKFIAERGKQADACASEYKRVLSSNNYGELLQVIKENYNWCYDNNVFTKQDIIDYIPNDVLLENGFYYDYNGCLVNDKKAFVYDSTIQDVRGNATIQDVRGNATIQNVRGNATIQNVWDNATIQNVWGNATIQNVWDNATYRIIRYGQKPKLFMKKDAFEIVEL